MSSIETQIQTNFAYLANMVSEFESLVETLDENFPQPELVKHGNGFAFRHKLEEQSDTLASYLKLKRIVSLLRASLHLINTGHTQEVYILCRSIDEATEDIHFFAISSDDPATTTRQERLLKEFYQEERADPTDPLSNSKRDRVPRKEIWAASTRIPNSQSDPTTFLKVVRSIYQTFSGYVHGTYASIMETFHPNKKRYQTKGMPNSTRVVECLDNLPNYIFRSIIALEALANRINRIDVVNAAIALNRVLANDTGCL